MNKIFQLLLIIIFSSGCSLNKNSKFWTSETIKKIEEQKVTLPVGKKDKLKKSTSNKKLYLEDFEFRTSIDASINSIRKSEGS